MRHDDALINDMFMACQKIIDFINGLDFEQFQQNELVHGAVIRQVLIIGEAARNVSEGLKKQYPVIEWKDTIGMRNILIHEYFNI
jgi:uncharacterized protein with HEPN domain